jgi:excisionase family DNA binding protein
VLQVLEMTREVMTVPEVAEFLRVTPKTVYALIREGELSAFRVGRVLRCHETAVHAFVGRRTRSDAGASSRRSPK